MLANIRVAKLGSKESPKSRFKFSLIERLLDNWRSKEFSNYEDKIDRQLDEAQGAYS